MEALYAFKMYNNNNDKISNSVVGGGINVVCNTLIFFIVIDLVSCDIHFSLRFISQMK